MVRNLAESRNSSNPKAPWIMPVQGFRVKRKKSTAPAAGAPPEVTYSDLATVSLRIKKGDNVSDTVLTLEPALEEEMEVLDMWVTPYLSGPTGMALDKVSTVNLSAAPKPDRWLMLSQGTTGSVYMPTVVWSSEAVYKPQGVSLGEDGNGLLPHQLNRVTLQGTTPGTASIYTGFQGTSGDALYPTEPAVRVAVYEGKELDLVVVPIAYQWPNGSATNPVLMETPQASAAFETSLQSFLDTVFLQQANVKVNVTVAPVVPARWDKGIGPVATNTPVQETADHTLQILQPILMSDPEKATLEEKAIFAAAPPSPDAKTLTIYYVKADNFVVVQWPDQDAENAAQASTLKYSAYWGWAPKMLRSGANIAWVMEHANDGSYTVKTTIAHEIGHKLGLSHSTELDAAACHLLNGDNENRLMTHRIGPKRKMGPIRLIHQEWVNIRNSQMLREARNQ